MLHYRMLALQVLLLAAASPTATASFRAAVEHPVPEQQLAAAAATNAAVSDSIAVLRQLRQSRRTLIVSNFPARTATTAAGELPIWGSPYAAAAGIATPSEPTRSESSSSSGASNTNSGGSGAKSQPTTGPGQSASPVTRPPSGPAPAAKETPKAVPAPTPKPEPAEKPAVTKEPPPPSKPAITPALQTPQSSSVNGGSSSSKAAGADKGGSSSSSSGTGTSIGSGSAAAPVPVTAVAPTPEAVRSTPTCPAGRTLKVHAASSSRMCVLQKATATEGLVWNAIGQQVSYSQAQKCYVAACPEGVKPEIPGQMPKSNIVTAQSAQRGTAQQPQPAPPPAAAAQGDGPTIIEIEEPGRRLLGSAAVQQDVFVVMSFAASCFSLCE